MNAKSTTVAEPIHILNVPFTCCSFGDILKYMDDAIIKNYRHAEYISITNTESLYHALRIPSHHRFIENATFSCCDGIGIVLAGKMLGHKIPRLHGPDLMLKCCEYGVTKGWRHYFYGGKDGVPQKLSKKLTKKFPGMITAGMYSPPFRPLTPAENEAVTEKINSVNPDILWVGLGLIKQEQWIKEHLDKVKVSWLIGVGAAFDFHAGTIRRAPKLLRNIGLEWLYRLAFEPRMFIRNIYSFSLILSLTKHVLRRRRNSLPNH
jgi:N-acetylglucosaminyldiphosphoundecaprenol N-acetyl-beta-D-mannosaminyltransferase